MSELFKHSPFQVGTVIITPEFPAFEDHLEFKPHYSPSQILLLGSFGGTYFNEKKWRGGVDNYLEEIPPYLWNRPKYNKNLNLFGVKCGNDQQFWEQNDWIHEDDPRGWLHWYFKFYYGRRHPDDARQISRWKKFPNRHLHYLKGSSIGQPKSKKTAQNLLHWGYSWELLIFDEAPEYHFKFLTP